MSRRNVRVSQTRSETRHGNHERISQRHSRRGSGRRGSRARRGIQRRGSHARRASERAVSPARRAIGPIVLQNAFYCSAFHFSRQPVENRQDEGPTLLGEASQGHRVSTRRRPDREHPTVGGRSGSGRSAWHRDCRQGQGATAGRLGSRRWPWHRHCRQGQGMTACQGINGRLPHEQLPNWYSNIGPASRASASSIHNS